ncbi:MAG: hypothetical protein GY874_05340 [Desulfobacteraceae bacterium]|nr:hypothetical protein [Desulfobacteraceae bacterium]
MYSIACAFELPPFRPELCPLSITPEILNVNNSSENLIFATVINNTWQPNDKLTLIINYKTLIP